MKTKWPECVDDHLTAKQCKDLIDDDVQTLFTGDDKLITTHILHSRSIMDENYNLVVIRTRATNGRVRGVFDNGMVYYDL